MNELIINSKNAMLMILRNVSLVLQQMFVIQMPGTQFNAN